MLAIMKICLSASLINFYDDNIEEYDNKYIVTNISFEAIVPSNKKYFFHQRMFCFVNKLELSGKKYQTNGNERDKNYNGKF